MTTNLVALILNYCRQREESGFITPQTARLTRYRLCSFSNHAAVDPLQVSAKHVQRWLDTKPAIATKLACVSMLSGFCDWCVLQGHMRRNPTLGLERPRRPKAAPRKLSQADAHKVALAASDRRMTVILLLMLQEGLRCAEVALVQLGDVDIERQTIAVRGKGGRGGITRHLPLSAESTGAVVDYLKQFPASAGPLIRSQIHPNRGLTPNYISQMVADLFQTHGLKHYPRDGRSAHALRHTALSHMLENGAPIEVVQKAAGHENVNTTMIYLSGVTPDLRHYMGGRTYLLPES